jgi:ERCC4-related helicase
VSVELKGIELRDYQKNIAETANQKNTLVVLPTGLGKTLISILVAVHRLSKFPESKVLIMAPTRALNAQHKKTFEKFTTIDPEKIVLITGKISPVEREKIYQQAKVIVATPQTIQNDLKNGKLSLEKFSFVTFDEAHRAIKDYAYPYIAKKYMLQTKNPLILALTASPGGSSDRINEICKNLFIKAVEIRTEVDTDVEKYVKPVEREFIYVDFPEDFKQIRELLQNVLKEDLQWLKNHHYLPSKNITKKMLISLQNKIGNQYSKTKNPSLIWALIRSAEAIKLEHAIEILETQDISFLYEYFQKLQKSKKRIDRMLLKNKNVSKALEIVQNLISKNFIHPKMEKVKNLVKDLLKQNPKAKIILFANYRSTVEQIKNLLCAENIPAEILIGQAVKAGKGMTQTEQIETLNRFRNNEFNVLVGTAISEEGLDVPFVEYAIFYEAVPSEIRAIQRRGRVGRQAAGKVIFLITKDTRDENYFFASLQKEKKMRRILYSLKTSKKLENKKSLLDWTSV